MPDESLILTTRSNDHFTSAEVISSPLWNLTPWRSVQVKTLSVSALKLHFVASTGCGPVLPGWYSSRCWKMVASSVADPKS